MAEYAVILGVITPAVILAFAVLSGAIGPLISRIADFLLSDPAEAGLASGEELRRPFGCGVRFTRFAPASVEGRPAPALDGV